MSEKELIDRVLAHYSTYYHGVIPDFRMSMTDGGWIVTENGLPWNILFIRKPTSKEPNVNCDNCTILLELARGMEWVYIGHEYVRNRLYGCESFEELEMRLDIMGAGN